jgi:hypothetical protein
VHQMLSSSISYWDFYKIFLIPLKEGIGGERRPKDHIIDNSIVWRIVKDDKQLSVDFFQFCNVATVMNSSRQISAEWRTLLYPGPIETGEEQWIATKEEETGWNLATY